MEKIKKEELSKILSDIIRKYDSLNDFATKCNISGAYVSYLINLKYTKAPSPEILKKIADNSKNIVSYMKLMSICGYVKEMYVEGSPAYIGMKESLDLSDLSEQDIELIKVMIKTIKENRKK